MIGITERGDAALDHSWMKWDGPKILITKAINKLPLDKIDPKTTIIHCTITGYGGTILEPNVPKISETIPVYQAISSKFHTVLRIDPIIPTSKGVLTAMDILSLAKGRVRISFIDMYRHVRERFEKAHIPLERLHPGLHADLGLRESILRTMESMYSGEIEVCGEPGMKCTGCVSAKDLEFFKIAQDPDLLGKQRKSCACLSLKKELLTNKHRCPHGCLYCYWYN